MALVLDLDFTSALDSRITFARAGTRKYLNAGVITDLATGLPAFESWDGVARGMSIDAAFAGGDITQGLLNSNTFSDASFSYINLTQNGAAGGNGPDGVASSNTMLRETVTNGGHHVKRTLAARAANSWDTFYTIVKRPAGATRWGVRIRMSSEFNNLGARAFFRIDDKPGHYVLDNVSQVLTQFAGMRKLANDHWLLWISGKWAATSTKEYQLTTLEQNTSPVDGSYAGDIAQGVDSYGFQVVNAQGPTGWMTTVGAAGTQAAETAIFNDTTWFSSAQGTFVVDHDCFDGPLIGSGANIVLNAWNDFAVPDVSGLPGRAAIAWDSGGSRLCYNGRAVVGTGTPSFGADIRLMGTTTRGNVGHIKRLRYYNHKMSDAELTSITEPTRTDTSNNGALRTASIENRLPATTHTTAGAQLNFAGRFRMKLADFALTKLKLDFCNFAYQNATVGNAVVIDAVYLERVTGVAESVQVLFGGLGSTTLADGAANILSDDILPSQFTGLSVFPASGEFWVRIVGHVTAAGQKFPISRSRTEPAAGQAFTFDTGSITNIASTGALVHSGGTTANIARGLCPILVGVYQSQDPKTCFISGDSLVEGVGNLADSGTFIRRGCAMRGLGVVEFSFGGSAQGTYSETTHWRGYLAYCRVWIDMFGTNDINHTLHFFTLWNLARVTHNYDRVMHVGLLPRTTSIDNWATEANQTVSRAYPETIDKMPDTAEQFGYLDAYYVPSFVRGTDFQKWKVDGTNNKYTSDGTHHTTFSDDGMISEFLNELDALEVTQAPPPPGGGGSARSRAFFNMMMGFSQ